MLYVLKQFRKWLFSILLVAALSIMVIMISLVYAPYQNILKIEKAARSGDTHAQRILGTAYETDGLRAYSFGRIRQDKAKAIYWYTKSALAGDKEASYFLARLYESSFKGTKNKEALYWYGVSEKQGSHMAAARLYVVYNNGSLGQKIDTESAMRWQQKGKRLVTD